MRRQAFTKSAAANLLWGEYRFFIFFLYFFLNFFFLSWPPQPHLQNSDNTKGNSISGSGFKGNWNNFFAEDFLLSVIMCFILLIWPRSDARSSGGHGPSPDPCEGLSHTGLESRLNPSHTCLASLLGWEGCSERGMGFGGHSRCPTPVSVTCVSWHRRSPGMGEFTLWVM